MRIAYVTTGLGVGGAERQVTALARWMHNNGHSVSIVSLTPVADNHLARQLSEWEAPIYSLDMSRGVPDPRAVLHLMRILRQTHCDIVHSHMIHANIVARLACALADLPNIATIHSVRESTRAVQTLFMATSRLSALTTAVSGPALERYRARHLVVKNKSAMMPNGVDSAAWSRSDAARDRIRYELGIQDAFVWLCAARLGYPKNQAGLLAALARVLEDEPSAHVVFVGEGPDLPMLRSAAARLGVESHVTWLGTRPDMADLLAAGDAFVLPSLFEGLPMVLLEASCAGIPIVATATAGSHEAIAPAHRALMPSPRPADLAVAMCRAQRRGTGETSAAVEVQRAYVRSHFELNSVASRWTEIYRAVSQGCPGWDIPGDSSPHEDAS